MNAIKIDQRDYDFLIQSKLNEDIRRSLQTGYRANYNTVELFINRETIGAILEFLDHDLAINGLKEDDEPNQHGIMLEGLIDKFATVYYADSK